MTQVQYVSVWNQLTPPLKKVTQMVVEEHKVTGTPVRKIISREYPNESRRPNRKEFRDAMVLFVDGYLKYRH